VGGGTLMDFARYSAYQLGIPFVAVPTIVSSDGFTADICSIIIDGQKKSIPMQAADAVICDMNIIAGAPMFLTVAGVQDILAKHISIADWKIASLVSGEYFCEKVCGMAQEALDIMVRCAHELAEGKAPDYEAMAYTQMLSGLTMQILSNSRAASGAEHLVAHLVEMKPRGFENAHGLHGECVGVGTILCAEAYHKLAERETVRVKPYEPLDEAWVRAVFGKLADGIMKENENDVLKTFDPQRIADCWPQIREIISAIPTAEELIELYTAIGAKHSLEELGIDPAVKAEFLDISSAIRNRLTLARMTRLIAE
jgi:glycerol-1-phosphate dehydrogenase [NAD(P)+]